MFVNLNFTPQNEGLDGGFGLPNPCAKDSTSPRGGEDHGWDVLAVHPLVNFLQKAFSANYNVLSLFLSLLIVLCKPTKR